jgi:hypothetical protein
MTEEIKNVSADRLAAAYIKVRDRRDIAEREWEAKDKALEETLDTISAKFLEQFKELGVESMRTTAGTVTRTVKNRFWTTNWDAFYALIKEHDAFELLEKRVAQTAIKEFLEQHPGEAIPGLQSDSKYAVSVRRAKEKV